MKKLYFLMPLLMFSLNLAALGLNDVSILLPLPKLNEFDLSPAPNTKTDKGEILPFNKISQIQPLLPNVNNRDLYLQLKMMGIRIDPCFFEGTGPVICSKQIRIVWQPVLKTRNNYSTHDVSIHVFYQLTDSEFKNLVTQLRKLSQESENKPSFLTVNSIISKQGYNGLYFKKLFSIIKQFSGSQNIIRTTFMAINLEGSFWTFGGYNFTPQGLKVMIVPRLTSANQFFTNTSSNAMKFSGGMAPTPNAPHFNNLISDSDQLHKLSENEILQSLKTVHQFENPLKHNAGTLDCMSCHLAQMARIKTYEQFPALNIFSKETYKSNLDLKNNSPLQNQTHILRAFGYFNDQPIISQRTINETAEVVKMIGQ